MRALFWLLGLFALAVALAVSARYNAAYALFVSPGYRVQISMNLLVLLVVVAFAGLYVVVRLAARALALPGAVEAFRLRRKQESAAKAMNDAERLFQEGRYGQAFKRAELAYDGVQMPGLAALLAARAAHALHEPERRQEWLRRAAEHDREVRMARLMAEAEMALADRRFDDAAQHLDALRSGGHRHLAVLRLALQMEQGRGRWDEVARLAHQLRKFGGLTHEQAAPVLRRAVIEQLHDAQGNAAELIRIWNSVPAEDRETAGFLVRAVPYLMAVGDERLAPEAIANALERDWDPELAVLYGRCKSSDMLAQLATAEKWLKEHPDDGGLLLTLGRLCLRGQLWGKAQSYIEASLSLAPSRMAHLELARLLESLERPADAQRHYREAAVLGA